MNLLRRGKTLEDEKRSDLSNWMIVDEVHRNVSPAGLMQSLLIGIPKFGTSNVVALRLTMKTSNELSTVRLSFKNERQWNRV